MTEYAIGEELDRMLETMDIPPIEENLVILARIRNFLWMSRESLRPAGSLMGDGDYQEFLTRHRQLDECLVWVDGQMKTYSRSNGKVAA